MYSEDTHWLNYLNVKTKSDKHYISIELWVGNSSSFQISNNMIRNKTNVKGKTNNILETMLADSLWMN